MPKWPVGHRRRAHLALTVLAENDLARAPQVPLRPAGSHPAASARPAHQGCPPLDGDLQRAAAETFLEEAARGPGIHDRIADRLEAAAGHPFTGDQVRNALSRAQQDGWITPGRRGEGAQRAPDRGSSLHGVWNGRPDGHPDWVRPVYCLGPAADEDFLSRRWGVQICRQVMRDTCPPTDLRQSKRGRGRKVHPDVFGTRLLSW